MNRETILVVDDSDELRDSVVNYMLEPNGYRCIEAHNGFEAFDLILSQAPELVLTDLQMPGLSGLGLLYKMRENGIQVPVVLMTFHGSEELAIEVFRLGVRDYVIKPFEDQELLEAVERALSEARLRRERDKLMEELVVANRNLSYRVAELEALFEVGKTLTLLPSLSDMIEQIIETSSLLLRARRTIAYLLETPGNTLVEQAIKEERGPVVFTGRAMRDSLVEATIRTGQPGASAEPFTDPATGRATMQLSAPIFIDRRPVGALSVDISPAEESDRILNLLAHLADYAALGLAINRLRN